MKKKYSAIRRTKGDVVFDCINVLLNLLLLFICLYPLYFVLLASFSDPYAVSRGEVFFWFKGFTTEPYTNLLSESNIWIGYRNTLFYATAGTLYSLILTIPCAYGLSKRALPGRRLFSIYFLIPMYFGGGLIPTYLVMKSLNMVNQWYSLIFIGSSSIYNMIVSRVFFESTIPEELYESARIDGASEFKTFFTIAMPLSGSILAVMALFFAVAKWNDYFNALVYITKNDYLPLQMFLRSMLLEATNSLKTVDTSSMDADTIAAIARRAYMAEAMKYSLIVIASAPLLIAYPFVQKYFVKGMMIGAVKG